MSQLYESKMSENPLQGSQEANIVHRFNNEALLPSLLGRESDARQNEAGRSSARYS